MDLSVTTIDPRHTGAEREREIALNASRQRQRRETLGQLDRPRRRRVGGQDDELERLQPAHHVGVAGTVMEGQRELASHIQQRLGAHVHAVGLTVGSEHDARERRAGSLSQRRQLAQAPLHPLGRVVTGLAVEQRT